MACIIRGAAERGDACRKIGGFEGDFRPSASEDSTIQTDCPPPPYFANAGPPDGPARAGSLPSAIGVSLDGDRPGRADGIAYGAGHLPHWRGPLATWRLVIGKVDVPGRWVLVSRRFVPIEEWEEREAIRWE